MSASDTVLTRLVKKMILGPERATLGRCWLWTGRLTSDGYSRFRNCRAMVYVHRWVYETTRGLIPEGMECDHLCRVRNCINPDHIEIVTKKTNILRGVGAPALNARRTHCLRGHALEGKNVYEQPSQPGTRRCLTCQRFSNWHYYRRDGTYAEWARLRLAYGEQV